MINNRNIWLYGLVVILLLFLYPLKGQSQSTCSNNINCRPRVLIAIAPGWVGNQSNAALIQQAEAMIKGCNRIMGQSIHPSIFDNGGQVGIEYGLTLAGVEVLDSDPYFAPNNNPFCSNATLVGTRLLCLMRNNEIPQFENLMDHYRADVGVIIRQMDSGVLGQADQSGYSFSPFLVLPVMDDKFFAHELGHVLGCVHGNCGGLSGIASNTCNGNGRGFRGNGFRTIMCQGGSTIDYYSNDWEFYQNDPSKPMGNSGNNGSDCACVVATNTPVLACFQNPFDIKADDPDNDVNFELYADHRVRESYTIQPDPGVTYSIEPDAKFVIRTGDFVDLKPGFWAKEESNFRARVKGCYPADPREEPDVFRLKEMENPLEEKLERGLVFDFTAQPNPFQNTILLELEIFQEEVISVQIVNQYGQMIDQVMEDMSLPIGSMNRKINTRDWASGLYIIQVVSKDQVKALKVLKE